MESTKCAHEFYKQTTYSDMNGNMSKNGRDMKRKDEKKTESNEKEIKQSQISQQK